MAYSKPTDEAQTPAVCQLCEESSDIRWKCINCDVFMCQLCTTKIHRKLKSTDHHELINLKDFGSENVAKAIRKVDLQNMPCTVHNDQMCCAFCADCDQPVCLDCLIEFHQKHKYGKLNEAYNTACSGIKDFQKNLESSQGFFLNEKKRLEKLLLDGDTNFQDIKNKVLSKEKEMTETISKYAEELLQELESIWKPTENKIKSELSDIQKYTEDLVTRETSLKKTLESHQASEIFSSSKNLDTTLPKHSVERIKCDILETKFLCGNILEKQNTRSAIFGDLYAFPDLELVGRYQSDLEIVQDILSCDNNITFVACYNEAILQKVNLEENNIKIEKDFSIDVRSMAKSKNDEILLATGESELKVYSIDKQFETFKSFSPFKAISVHVSQNNEIFVGLAECFPVTFPAIEDSVRRVVVINQEGDIHHTYEYDKDNRRLFTEPSRITTFNDKIYIIDSSSVQWEGRVIAIDYGGELLWTYKGYDNDGNKDNFYPTDIITTSSNYILISDQHNHALNVLNSAGDVIVCKYIKSLGIELPLCLCFDKDETLWIGCNTWAADKDGKSKIFAVKLVK